MPPGDSMAMALVQRRAPDAHNFLFPRRHPISGLEIMELRDDPRNSLNRPDVVLRKWHFGYAVSSGEASESHLPCSSVAQWRAEHG